jgi:hypothetical protein
VAVKSPAWDSDLEWRPNAPATLRLAQSLRTHRLTVLWGEAGVGKTSFLTAGLLPLLRRRSDDATVKSLRAEPRVVVPFPDRRRPDEGRLAEIVVLSEASGSDPLGVVSSRLDNALRAAEVKHEFRRLDLADRVQALTERFGSKFLFVIDDFEAVLDRSDRKAWQRRRFVEELIKLLSRPIASNVLLVVRVEDEATLQSLVDLLPEVDVEYVHLARPVNSRAKDVVMAGGDDAEGFDGSLGFDAAGTKLARAARLISQRWNTATVGRSRRDESMSVADVHASIEDTLSRTSSDWFSAANSQSSAFVAEPDELAYRGGSGGAPIDADTIDAGSVAMPESLTAPRTRADARAAADHSRWRYLAYALSAVIVVLALILLSRQGLGNREQTSMKVAPPAAAPSPAVLPAPAMPNALPMSNASTLGATTPPPSIELAVEGEDGQAPRMLSALSDSLTDDGAVKPRLRIVRDGLARLQQLANAKPAAPGLAVVRYDALQAAAAMKSKAPLAIVAPLFTEEMYFIVRADSPLQFIHQIEGQRIGIGAARSGSARTAANVYRSMFGKAIVSPAQGSLEGSAAITRLVEGSQLDVVFLCEPQPSATIAALPPDVRSRIKILRLDADHPSSVKALREYLPASLKDTAAASSQAPSTEPSLASSVAASLTSTPTPTLAAMSFLVTEGVPAAWPADVLDRFAQSLCRSLVTLQRDGDPKWRTVKPTLEIATPWPAAKTSASAWSECTR